MTQTIAEKLCAVAAASDGQDPICTGTTLKRLLAVEVAMPWGESLYKSDAAGTLQERVNALRLAYFQRLQETGEREQISVDGLASLYGIAPDAEWSRPDVHRVLLLTRPQGAFSGFDLAEYHFPSESERLFDFVQTYFDAPDGMAAFENYRVEHGGYRELFVCTHGHVDICCAKFGIPLYNQARAAYPRVRAWRMTHFGGHRYAPTAWEFPSGYKWAFLDEAEATNVIERRGEPESLHRNVRGCSGVPVMTQILDRVGLDRYGWDWLDYRRSGEVLEADTEAKRWRVRLRFESPAGRRGVYEGVVVVGRFLPNVGCGPHWGEYDHQSPEYVLESFSEQGGL